MSRPSLRPSVRSVPAAQARVAVVALLASLVGIGCGAGSPPPGTWLPGVEAASRDPFGGWVELHGVGGAFQQTLLAEGELIAVGPDTIFVASSDWDTLRRWAVEVRSGRRISAVTPEMTTWADTVSCEVVAVPRAEIRWLELYRYRGTDVEGLEGTVSGLGILTSFAHGWFAVISVPVWIGAAVTRPSDRLASPTVSYRPDRPTRPSSIFGNSSSARPVRDERWEALRSWARYPQGIPASVERESLRPRLEPLLPAPVLLPEK